VRAVVILSVAVGAQLAWLGCVMAEIARCLELISRIKGQGMLNDTCGDWLGQQGELTPCCPAVLIPWDRSDRQGGGAKRLLGCRGHFLTLRWLLQTLPRDRTKTGLRTPLGCVQLLFSLVDQDLFGREPPVGDDATTAVVADLTARYSSFPFVEGTHPQVDRRDVAGLTFVVKP
jgi:hypothetical protein